MRFLTWRDSMLEEALGGAGTHSIMVSLCVARTYQAKGPSALRRDGVPEEFAAA
jgi:hypothetical protein